MNFAKTSVYITILLVFAHLLSFLKESIIANYFGISLYVDAYNIAIQIPVVVFAFVAVAIKSVIIPLYSEIIYNKGKTEADHFANNFITLNILIALVLTLTGECFSGFVIKLFAPGFDETTHNIAVSLLRLTLPTMVFTVVTDVVTGVLNVHKKLVLPCFAVYFLQLSLIFMIVVFHEKLGIRSACIGQVLGSFLQMTYLYLVSTKVYKYRLSFNFKAPEVKTALKMSWPVIWGISVAEVNAVINRMVGSFLFVGSISALSYAGKLNTVFMTFFVSAVSTIVFPLYSESAAKKDMVQLNSRVNFTLSLYSALLIPVMCMVFCLRREIIELAFARGAFDKEAVELTQSVLGCYVLGMLFSSFRETLTKVFYSLKDTKTTAKNATLGVVINIVLNLTLPWVLGVKGLALGTSISAIFISMRLLWLLKKKEKAVSLNYFFSNIKTIVLLSVLAFIVVFVLRNLLVGQTALIKFLVCGSVTTTAYLLAIYLVKPPVIEDALQFVKYKRK